MSEPVVGVVSIRPGDAVLIRIDEHVTADTQKIVHEHFRKLFAEAGHLNVPMMVIDKSMSVQVLRNVP